MENDSEKNTNNDIMNDNKTDTLSYIRSFYIPYTGGMVAFDWILTILSSITIAIYSKPYLPTYLNISLFSLSLILLIILLIISIYLHVLFETPTITNYYLGLSKKPLR